MGYVTIASKLVELLETISGLTVYDHEPKELATFPCVTVQAAGHRHRFADTAANDRLYSFSIRLFYDDRNEQDAETILRTFADQVVTVLEENVVVEDVWDIAQPTEAVWRFVEREIPMRIAEITVNIKKREHR